jgi:flavin reductase (DIM6/NTAB) family NADH-FMN oxidoreductase RutF
MSKSKALPLFAPDVVPCCPPLTSAELSEADAVTMAAMFKALADALVSLDCRVTEINEVGTHSVFFGEVAAIRLGAPRPALVYLHRKYRSL